VRRNAGERGRGAVWAVATSAALLLGIGAPVPAGAQAPAKVYHVGVLANSLDTSDGPLFQVFLDALRGLGYMQDRNMTIEWRSSEGEAEKLPELAADLARAKVDVIVATALQPAHAVGQATKTIPIVFVVTADPVGHGLVANAARPGGNMTGLAIYAREESSDRVLELIKATNPRASSVAVLTNPDNPIHRELLAQALPAAAQRTNIRLVKLEARSAADLQKAFETAVRERADALYVLGGDPLIFINRARIVELAAKNRLPAIYTGRSAVEAGGLMSYGPKLRDLFQRAASYVDKILKGARPGDLPVERSTKFELVINLKTAKALGLGISPPLLQRADAVIQ
jgi:putative ABC transport system substrate-binding protein